MNDRRRRARLGDMVPGDVYNEHRTQRPRIVLHREGTLFTFLGPSGVILREFKDSLVPREML